MKRLQLIGNKFGKLVVVKQGEQASSPSRKHVTWYCICDCGNSITVKGASLTSGNTTSCGCAYIDSGLKRRTSRVGNESEYISWSQMKQRCMNPKNQDFYNYGGRGVKVCDEWKKSFDAFLKDMGNKPGKNFSIDRIDCDGNYEKSNCRWATPLEQSRNRRNTKYFKSSGEFKNVA